MAADANTKGSDNTIMKSTIVPSMLSCAYECLKDSDCKSILMEKSQQQGQDNWYQCNIIDGTTFFRRHTTSEAIYFRVKEMAFDFLGDGCESFERDTDEVEEEQ